MASSDNLNHFIIFIFVLKVIFLLIFLYNHYLQNVKHADAQTIAKYQQYENIIEVIVLLCLGILLIWLFHPRNKGPILVEGETKTMLFLLGIILLISIREFWRVIIFSASTNTAATTTAPKK